MLPSLLRAALGGVMIGGAAAMLLIFNGRIVGVSGVLGTALSTERQERGERSWRFAFLGGLLLMGALFAWLVPGALAPALPRTPLFIAASGLLVGFGTRLGNGCTSGHGVCGIGRFSPRSMVATATFILAGMVAAFALGHLIGRS
jgi:uncharacterized membrane protein YedE/YeeE